MAHFLSVFRRTTASLHLIKRAPTLALEAVGIVFLRIWEMSSMMPFLMGFADDRLLPRVKFPPARLHDLGSDR